MMSGEKENGIRGKSSSHRSLAGAKHASDSSNLSEATEKDV